jgi:hypothetical protein
MCRYAGQGEEGQLCNEKGASVPPCALPEASPQDTHEALPCPILWRLSSPRYTVLRLAAGRSGGCRTPPLAAKDHAHG